MPTIFWVALNFIVLALAIAGLLVLSARVLGLQMRLQECEVQMANVERSERLTPARLAQLAEVNTALDRAEQLLLKVNRREIAAAKKRDSDGTYISGANGSDKDALRRRAGLRAGHPAPHS